MMKADRSLEGLTSTIRMLLIEDSQHDADFIAMMLNRSQEIEARIDHVKSLAEAIAACDSTKFDIVLLDLGLPDSSGTDSVASLKARAPDTPIVVLTGDDRHATAMDAIQCGAQDFLPKQHVVTDMLARMMHHSIARNNRLIQAQSEAFIDVLTGLPNRRACEAELDRRLSDFRRYQNPFSVAIFDVDHFKQINDTWGHEVGDRVILAVASTLAKNLRESDQVARFGGEEFAATLAMTRLPDAEIVVSECLKAVSRLRFDERSLRVTVSAGVTEIASQDDARSLFVRADKALYAAKRAGRNRYSRLPVKVSDGLQSVQIAGAAGENG